MVVELINQGDFKYKKEEEGERKWQYQNEDIQKQGKEKSLPVKK